MFPLFPSPVESLGDASMSFSTGSKVEIAAGGFAYNYGSTAQNKRYRDLYGLEAVFLKFISTREERGGKEWAPRDVFASAL